MPPAFEELLLDLETTFMALLTPFDMSTGDSRAAMFFDGSLLQFFIHSSSRTKNIYVSDFESSGLTLLRGWPTFAVNTEQTFK